MGAEAQGMGYDYLIRDVEENSMVGAICDLVERVWSHGLVVRDGKSALWTTLRKQMDRWKEKHPQCSPCEYPEALPLGALLIGGLPLGPSH